MTNRTGTIIAAGVLLSVQAVMTYGLQRTEFLPSPAPLTENIPSQLGSWKLLQDGVLEPEVFEMLAPDDVLNRIYRDGNDPTDLSVFVGYYKTQMRAKNAHDPKVCLPGSGWNPLISKTIDIPLAESGEPSSINYYVISRGGQRAVVLYWFQNHKYVMANEQGLKLSRLKDNFFENRTDMALVRIVYPVGEAGLERATEKAIEFAKLFYPPFLKQFPATT